MGRGLHQGQFPRQKIEPGHRRAGEKVDRLDWTTTAGLTRNLLEHFGVTFRAYLKDIDLFFDGVRVEPTDPLFTTPGCDITIWTKIGQRRDRRRSSRSRSGDGPKGPHPYSLCRFSADVLSGRQDEAWRPRSESEPALSGCEGHAGILVCRMGRQIDVLENTPWEGLERFHNDDRYWGMEIDFPAELDEDFTISNAKQGGRDQGPYLEHPARKMGVLAAIRQLRRDYEGARKPRPRRRPSEDEKRPSEKAMEDSAKFPTEAGADAEPRARGAGPGGPRTIYQAAGPRDEAACRGAAGGVSKGNEYASLSGGV